jgi:hypothetical protein
MISIQGQVSGDRTNWWTAITSPSPQVRRDVNPCYIVCTHDICPMGRHLDPTHRAAAIAWWRQELATLLANPLFTVRRLADSLAVGEPLEGPAKASVARAAKSLKVAMQSPAATRQAAVDDWIDRYLVEAGRSLLIPPARRALILANMRDADRRSRQAERQVVVRVAQDVLDRLRRYRRRHKLGSDTEAIGHLLEARASKKPQKSDAKQVVLDLD